MQTKKPKNILVAPLDWGLGHTTRCVPLIRYIRQQGHNPIVAGNESQLSFIRETFDNDIQTTPLDGYNVTYSGWNRFLQMGLLAQLPSISAAIGNEHRWLLRQAGKLQLDGIISDNRYGLFHPAIPSVIITHQLQVLSGLGGLADRMVQRVHYKYLSRFKEIWVPDLQGNTSLGGKLSHPDTMPKDTKYIGLLSRFENAGMTSHPALTPHLPLPGRGSGRGFLILLSGPEPQRSILSATLWKQVVAAGLESTFVEGSEAAVAPANIPPHITYHKRLAGEPLAQVLTEASMVVCRSGYSTIMDLVALGKKAILIPTPGQTEQEYLASHLHGQGIFYTMPQKNFDLQKALAFAEQFPSRSTNLPDGFKQYCAALQSWILTI